MTKDEAEGLVARWADARARGEEPVATTRETWQALAEEGIGRDLDLFVRIAAARMGIDESPAAGWERVGPGDAGVLPCPPFDTPLLRAHTAARLTRTDRSEQP